MKFNFNKIIQIIKRYKYVLLFLIILVIFLCSSSSIIEGLTGSIGEYDFLAPVVENIDFETWKTFFQKYYNKSMTDEEVKSKLGMERSYLDMAIGRYITKTELEYYIANGKFPYNGYVINFLTNNTNILGVRQGQSISDRINELQKLNPNRVIFENLMYSDELAKTPQPLALKIFLGTEKPPTTTTSTTTPPTPTPSIPRPFIPIPSTPTPSIPRPFIPIPSIPTPSNTLDVKMKRNYERLVSLCEKVVN
jgi:hypothetical protein